MLDARHDTTDRGLGALALERGLISPDDLQNALAEQARESASANGRSPRPLGVILVSRGRLSDTQLTDLLEEVKTRDAETAATRRTETRLGRILIEARQATPEQVDECLRAQEACIHNGLTPVPRLGQLLVQRGFASAEAVRRALASQRKTLLECTACRKRYNIRHYDPTRTHRCRVCGGILAPRSDIDGVGVHASGEFPAFKGPPPAIDAGPGEAGPPPPPDAAPPAAPPPDRAPTPDALPDAPASPDRPNLGKYTIIREVGRGGMGSVYEAVLFGALGFEKTVAVKTIRDDLSRNEDFFEMFVGEAKLVADLVHQNIVQVYQLDKVADCYYIVMEYVAGVNLKQLMDRHRERGLQIPVDLGTFIISRVCRALEYAHTKRDKHGRGLGIVHRDISPKNILITTEGEVKLTDFGVAKARNRAKDLEGELCLGKVQYMSPEQALFRPTDPRSDLFSLGVVMYELLAGQQIFEGGSTSATVQNVVHRHIPPPHVFRKDLPPEVEAIVVRAAQRDATRRYPDAAAMGHDLEYAIYHKGYGPTIQTLEKYMRSLFPELYPREEEGITPS